MFLVGLVARRPEKAGPTVSSVQAALPALAGASGSRQPLAQVLRFEFRPMASIAEAFAEPPPPTLESVEQSLRAAYAPKGISYGPLLRLMAMDRVHMSYRQAIARAKQSVATKDFPSAIRILNEGLEGLEPDHSTARLALLKMLDVVCRQSGRFDLSQACRERLKAVQKELMEMCVRAGREGGLSEDKLKLLTARLQGDEKGRETTRRATDWLSGAELAGPVGDRSQAPGKD
jgi:hypothetical protein